MTTESFWGSDVKTDQQIFDQVARHLLTQKKLAYDPFMRRCKLRIIKDQIILKCAIGCLIPDDLYFSRMEEMMIVEIVRDVGDKLEIGISSLFLLQQLQSCHDNTYVHFWKDQLLKIAFEFCLDPEVVKLEFDKSKKG